MKVKLSNNLLVAVLQAMLAVCRGINMMNVTINPFEGISIDNKKVNLGMSRAEVASILGKAECENGNRQLYFDCELAVDYDGKDTVEFMEFSGGPEGTMQPYIYGVSAFESNAEELLELLKSNNGGEVIDNEEGFAYCFDIISVGVTKKSTPESVQQDIEDMKADGVFDQNYVDEELKNANHWATVGLGRVGYYK